MVSANFETMASGLAMFGGHSPFCNWGLRRVPLCADLS